jgi:hypothetical protein
MKRWIIPLLVGIVAAGTLTLAVPQTAQAQTVSQSGPTTVTNALTLDYANCLNVFYRAGNEYGCALVSAAITGSVQPVPSGGDPRSHVSVTPGWFNWTLNFDHADSVSVLTKDGIYGAITTASLVCLAVGVLNALAGLACGVWVASWAVTIIYMLDVAALRNTPAPAWWCFPGQWLCSAASVPGAYWDPLSDLGQGAWIIPMYISGISFGVGYFGNANGSYFTLG